MKKTLLTIIAFGTSLVAVAQCWQQVATDGWHTLGIKTDGTIWAWGNNQAGQLGNSSNVTNLTPTRIDFDNLWSTVSVAPTTSMAIRSDGRLFGWGDADYGEVGNGQTSDVYLPALITNDTWKAVGEGSAYTIAIRTDGTLWAWGGNGPLHFGSTTPESSMVPVQVGTETNWDKISVGADHALAIKTDGTLWVWGNNFYGELGTGDNLQRITPVQIGTDNTWVKIWAGGTSSAALKADGTLWAWGENEYYNFGLGTFTNYNSPQQLTAFGNCVDAAIGLKHTLAIRTDGTLWSCGKNGDGQLGIGTYTTFNSTVTQIGSATNWVKVFAGENHSFAINASGQLYTWGRNDRGEMGLADGIDLAYNLPELVSCGALGIDDASVIKSGMHPNPATNLVMFNSDVQSVSVYSLDGKLINITLQNNQMDITNLQNGIYIVKGKTHLGYFTEKLIKR